MPRRPLLILACLCTMVATFAAAHWYGRSLALDQLHERAEARLTLSIDRLTLQLDRFRYLPAVLSRHPDIGASLVGDSAGAIPEANRLLERIADTSGALDIYVMTPDGTTIAASNHALDRSFLGQNFAWRPYFQRAVTGGLGYYHAVGTTSGQRGFYFSHPIRDDAARIIGVLVVKVDLERIESSWRGESAISFFADRNNVIFLSNRTSLILKSRRRDPIPLVDPRQYAGFDIQPLAAFAPKQVGRHSLWTDIDIDGLPAEALYLERDVPRINMTGHILVDVAPANAQAALYGGLGAALAGLFWLMAAIFLQRRAALAARLSLQEAARSELESKVEDRTRELSGAIQRLQDEVEVRTAAEQELRRVQAQLVQAGKLKALGEMSAGISHELNQPLAAIQSLSDNAEILLDRKDTDAVLTNIGKISALAERMGRIIRNLRAFARNEGEPAGSVDLAGVVADAVTMVAGRAREQAITIDWDDRAPTALVHGGKVRLQQVLINLLSNAIDAMKGQAEPRLVTIWIETTPDRIRLHVTDTGPGLTASDRIFDPFYTTKTVGEGMGLGLSISYGIVESFGGRLSGQTRPEGGAEFVMDLRRAVENKGAA